MIVPSYFEACRNSCLHATNSLLFPTLFGKRKKVSIGIEMSLPPHEDDMASLGLGDRIVGSLPPPPPEDREILIEGLISRPGVTRYSVEMLMLGLITWELFVAAKDAAPPKKPTRGASDELPG